MEGPMPTENTMQASSQATGNPPRSTTSSLNVMDNATPVISHTNRVFTLFPKLPLELRRKIWKHTLPGPRVVPICAWNIRSHGSRAVAKLYASLNSSINITKVCHEARFVVMETYDWVLNVVWQLSNTMDHEPDAFVYVDYNIDTVYVGDNAAKRNITCSLGKVQHLACDLDQPGGFADLAMLRRGYPMLKGLTVIPGWDVFSLQHKQEWRLLDVSTDLGPAITKPQLTPYGSYHEETLAKVLDDHGNLAHLCAEAKEKLERFEKKVRDQAEWKAVSLKVAVLTRRKVGSQTPWILTYPIYDTIMEEYDHWHEESISLGDEVLTSCIPVFHANHLCDDCGVQRWLQSNDAFWLCKDEREEDNRISGQHDSSARSAENMADEEIQTLSLLKAISLTLSVQQPTEE